jgi:hypothetical protein
MKWVAVGLVSFLTLVAGVEAQQSAAGSPPLSITTNSLPPAERRREYHAELKASGGVAPYHWTVTSGQLPDGIEMNPDSGVISGIPRNKGDTRLTVAVTDSSHPVQRAERELIIASARTLSLQWATYPRVSADSIYGSVVVENGGKDDFDQTVIILAINEHGKAFTLGYQRVALKANSDQEIVFGSTLSRGKYVVHADAIAEVEAKGAIYRNHLYTLLPLVVVAP